MERSKSNLDANPLTRLPGNIAIVKAIKSKIGCGKPYAIGYADLNNFKAYNDKYGFNKGDQVISFAAKVIVGAVNKLSPEDNFVGHVGGDDFIFVCGYEKANEICELITETFDKEIPKFYSEEDRNKGYIVVEDRRGVISQFPLVSIAIGMVSDEGKKFANLGQVNHSLTQLKKYAKSFQGSAYVRDRRTLAANLAEFTWGPGSAGGSSQVLESITSALGGYMPGQLTDIIKNASISVLFQPVIDMRADEVMGQESLVRGPSGTPLEFPDALFQTARGSNMVVDLDILCMHKILAASRELHNGIKLFINIFPETLLDEDRLKREILDDPIRQVKDVIFELSGSHRASDASELFATLRRLKETGLKVCIDSNVAFMGHGLRHLPELRPNYIKLNMMSYKDMANDFQKQEEFLRTVGLIRNAGSEVICTKLESRADYILALKAGITMGQGFLFARPAQMPYRQAG
jgi:diguanylate cyclase (GGDEF)-like protein